MEVIETPTFQLRPERLYLTPSEEREMILHVGGVALNEHLTAEPFDGVIGVARGGWPVAQGVAQIFNFRNDKLLAGSLSLYNGDKKDPDNPVWGQMPSEEEVHGKRWLVCDDLADGGDTLAGLLERLHDFGARTRTLTLLQKPHSVVKPDITFGETEEWVVFSWEMYAEYGAALSNLISSGASSEELGVLASNFKTALDGTGVGAEMMARMRQAYMKKI